MITESEIEDAFLGMFEDAGFHGIEILVRQAEPWQVIDGIKFRSMTVRAYKGKQDPCHERHQAVMYKGPWKQVTDDDGHTLLRGQRIDVCDKTCHILADPAGPYAGQTVAIEPYNTVPPEHAKPIPCTGSTIRHPRQTKGENYYETPPSHSDCCTPGTSGLC